ARHRVTLFDWRNSGLSGPAASFAVDSMIDDLESMIRAAGLLRFDLWAQAQTIGIAVEYAARHPGNVRKLILGRPMAGDTPERNAFGMSPTGQALSDWDSFCE